MEIMQHTKQITPAHKIEFILIRNFFHWNILFTIIKNTCQNLFSQIREELHIDNTGNDTLQSTKLRIDSQREQH